MSYATAFSVAYISLKVNQQYKGSMRGENELEETK
jgi:hypothetical protein